MWSIRSHFIFPKKRDGDILRYCFCRFITNDSTSRFPLYTTSTSSLKDTVVNKLRSIMVVYEDFIGVKDVQAAHTRVMQAEEKFINSQESRRNAHKELVAIQTILRELRSELDRIPRGNEKYLELVTKEINVMREEKQFREQFEDHEGSERSAFNELSSALRFSHEKEKAQNEKTKYWSIMGSLIGAFVGIVGTSINSRMKLHQLRKVMEESSAQNLAQVQEKLNILCNQIDVASKIKLASPGATMTDTPGAEMIESKLLTTVNLITKQIDEFNQQLEKLNVPSNSVALSLNDSHSSVVPIITYDDTQLKRNIQYATLTILICVPLITRILGTFWGN